MIINSIREHFSDSDDTSLAINLSIYSENDIFNQVAVFYPYRIDQTNLGKTRNILSNFLNLKVKGRRDFY